MLNTLKNNRSLTFYQLERDPRRRNNLSAYAGGVEAFPVASTAVSTKAATTGLNAQCAGYIRSCQLKQDSLLQGTSQFLEKVHASIQNPTYTQLRNKGNWSSVKTLVNREELMKLQFSKETELPVTRAERQALYNAIKNKDLSAASDKELNALFDSIVKRDEQAFLDAFKAVKATGKPTPLVQPGKLADLEEHLKNIDLSKITKKELNFLIKNFGEKINYHHITSISSDPSKQSLADNIKPLDSTGHKKAHYNAKTGKTDYSQPTTGAKCDRIQQIRQANQSRVLKNELGGLGLAAAIGAGIGFAMEFITTLAQGGVAPDSFKLALANGAKGGSEAGILSAVSYGISRTIGQAAGTALTGVVTNSGITLTENIAEMCAMGAVGVITIALFSVYQLVKLKKIGVATREALIQTGKQMGVSIGILALSILAQGIWQGHAGIIVSVISGVGLLVYSIGSNLYQGHASEKHYAYMINELKPVFT